MVNGLAAPAFPRRHGTNQWFVVLTRGEKKCWNLIPDSLDQVESQMDSNAIYYFEFQTWNLDLQPT